MITFFIKYNFVFTYFFYIYNEEKSQDKIKEKKS